jgi:alpha-beta hydrolase superfamily lysophospholipase
MLLTVKIDAARQRFPKSPLFVMGHGNGGSEALAFLGEECEQAKAVQGVVLLSPRCDRGSYYSRFLQFCIKVHSIKRIDVQDVWDTRDISKDFRHMRLPAATLKHIFQTCDSGDSGKLGLAEFARALNTEMRLGLSTEEIQETFKKFDADGSGQVSIDELVTTISYYCPEYDYCVKSLPTSIDFAWYDDAMKPERITAPTLLVHGLQNRVNTFEAAKCFVNAMSSEDKTIQCFESLRQGTACDLDAPRVLHSVVSWLDART